MGKGRRLMLLVRPGQAGLLLAQSLPQCQVVLDQANYVPNDLPHHQHVVLSRRFSIPFWC